MTSIAYFSDYLYAVALGYLQLANRDTLIYQVTGKLDYFYQSLQFIQEHEEIPIEQGEEESTQETLF
ncbi:hypothetical protein [methanotrophic endosymbiont of Bathymodiolus puteoserpentis (Logatchev)]|uniref:hypothetical protein n=1 Tax=methanotrophic endosymbiont of Bathymodiolus puteoserpentis (Logatchev) TaxID=343235 RepID=UPI0013C989A5|nr:hypothetical protein [methanotrophic endosymbiont of Bathymodiolus puteoserpentis (Logatchev)]SHE19163.1 hypothetical protein BPUTEOMOX_217 [methanotrophic endosymbiont of Bathymodiolus puteoserpentis (Logatchev)]